MKKHLTACLTFSVLLFIVIAFSAPSDSQIAFASISSHSSSHSGPHSHGVPNLRNINRPSSGTVQGTVTATSSTSITLLIRQPRASSTQQTFDLIPNFRINNRLGGFTSASSSSLVSIGSFATLSLNRTGSDVGKVMEIQVSMSAKQHKGK